MGSRQIRTFSHSCIMYFLLLANAIPAVDFDFNLEDEPSSQSKAEGDDRNLQSVANKGEKTRISQRDVFSFMQEQGKVSAASKIDQSLREAPGNVSVLTASDFLHFGYFDINEALYHQAGFFPSQDYDRRTLGSRGLFEGWNNNHYLLLMDGIPHNDNLYGTAYTWEITPVSFIKSLEIVRGPGSALYGSNATNGVLAINTLSGSDMKGKFELRTRAGSQNTIMTDILTGNQNSLLQYFIGASYNQTKGVLYKTYDDFNISGRKDTEGNPMQTENRDARSNHYLFIKIQGVNEWENVSFQVHHQTWDFETGHGWFWMIPDQRESMKENRQLISLSYKDSPGKKFMQEYTVRYQNHGIDWNMRYTPDKAYSGFYPDGVNEYLRTGAQDIFGRTQFTLLLPLQSNLLAGFEGSVFYYSGDEEHYGNSDPDNAFYPFLNSQGHPNVGAGDENTTRPNKPWFDYVINRPVYRGAGYTQVNSGRLFSKYAQLTLGARYDTLNFTYRDIAETNIPDVKKTFSQISPRAALVLMPFDSYALKFLAGKAFRDPAPAEMFGAHTWSLASNIKKLKPETVTTGEVVSQWDISKSIQWNLSSYYTKFENQIVYSEAAVNQSTNVYTLTTAGGESELLLRYTSWRAFMNYSFAKRMAETVNDFLVTSSPETLTWAPAHTAKIGFTFENPHFLFSTTAMYQHEVLRRSSDLEENPDLSQAPSGFTLANRSGYKNLRSTSIPSWIEVTARLVWYMNDSANLGMEIKNALGQKQYLLKNNMHPFDYQRNERSIYGYLRISI